jgi:hypothetical protein
MNNNYQINLPAGMPPKHPDHSTTVTLSLAATPACRDFYSSIIHSHSIFNMQEISALSAESKNIFPFNLFTNQKKEVNDIKMNTKHCKSIQYETN